MAGQYTPLEWQVSTPSDEGLPSSLAELADGMETNNEPQDVIVALRRCLPPSTINEQFAGFGRITYIGQLLSTVHFADVPPDRLLTLAENEVVARIDPVPEVVWASDVSPRFVQARRSIEYCPLTAEGWGRSGRGVAIAVVDVGVDDAGHDAFAGLQVRGFDASNPHDPEDGSSNPVPSSGQLHGSRVAAIALGRVVKVDEHEDEDGEEPFEFSGVAPEAALVDVKIRTDASDLVKALDWLARMRRTGQVQIDVVNLSLAVKPNDDGSHPSLAVAANDDGSHPLAQQVDQLTALGMTVVAGHGNARELGLAPKTRFTAPPGSASSAITVSAVNDFDVILRKHHELYDERLLGPRKDFDTHRDPLALKPDLAAPGVNIYSPQPDKDRRAYGPATGTSFAAPHVAGAAAILLEEVPGLSPASLKEVLLEAADDDFNSPYDATLGTWDAARGAGLLNVGRALEILREARTSAGDVRFPHCQAPGEKRGEPCKLAGSRSFWDNVDDVRTLHTPFRKGEKNTLVADVRYDAEGGKSAEVEVRFGVYPLAVGNDRFHWIGSERVSILPGKTLQVEHEWTPPVDGLYCFQIEIAAARDREHGNNVTRRCTQLLSSNVATLRVENPFGRPARFRFEATAEPAGWSCRVKLPGDGEALELDPASQCPVELPVSFTPPHGVAQPREVARCEIRAFASPRRLKEDAVPEVFAAESFAEEQLLGGVTLESPLE